MLNFETAAKYAAWERWNGGKVRRLGTFKRSNVLRTPGQRLRRLIERAGLMRFASVIFQPGSQYYDLSGVVQAARQPAVSGPTTLVYCTFTANNGTTLNLYPWPAGDVRPGTNQWAARLQANAAVNGNKMQNTALGFKDDGIITTAGNGIFWADYVSATRPAVGSWSETAYYYFRFTSAANYWVVDLSRGSAGPTVWNLRLMENGLTQRASTTLAATDNTLYQVKIVLSATSFECFVNGVSKLTYASIDDATATIAGLGLNFATTAPVAFPTWDEFKVTTLT
jgi:hypothetical protein